MAVYYLSKWRKEWIEFKSQPPGEGEIIQMKKIKLSNKNNTQKTILKWKHRIKPETQSYFTHRA